MATFTREHTHCGSTPYHGALSFMNYDLGYFDLETRVLEPLENPFGPKVLPMFLGTLCNPCVRAGPDWSGAPGGIRTPDLLVRSKP
jgi:hypothetical protein